MRSAFKLLASLALLASSAPVFGAGTRVKDIAMVSGARENQLIGYGLVVGLATTGDKDPVYTVQTMANILQRFGITVPSSTLSAKNVAVVMVTADIPAFKKPGTKIDVTVASMGDAKSLQGGVLLQTELRGADNQVYAVAQGPLALGGISASGGSDSGGGASVVKNHPTVGQVVNGALVEQEIPAHIVTTDQHLELLLRDPDFTSAARMAAAINEKFTNSAEAIDSTTVRVKVPDDAVDSPIDFVARIEMVEVTPDVPARIIMNERTGTIVATASIQISACAVSQGNITITVATSQNVSQPNALSQTGTTQVTTQADAKIKEEKGALITLPDLPTVDKVASALNALGVTPRDMMSIFQAMKQAGALQAELITR